MSRPARAACCGTRPRHGAKLGRTTSRATNRRTVLIASTAALTAGCGGGDGGTGTASADPSGTASSARTSLARTSDIPVGGGTVFAHEKVVVTQPTAGEFKAFSAVCTHQGCLVNKVADGTIDCPCHGSKYRVADGAVAAGPAPRSLPAQRITVSGETITLA
ncbi:Rieske (2Fe-2S) protein [Streptomyces sp. NPDC001728]|uniref:Rieske (2Fe-2S) protein n=1 Tax=Streptomyces sp. NPDC001728 TaxID=3154396 RepID=UPI00332EBD83